MVGSKTALGIDISDSRISLALLKSNKDGIELLRAASGPVPDGAIKHGNIEDAALLAHAIKDVRTRNKIRWTNQTGVSLLAKPVVMQILDTPKGPPTNIGQFVRNEFRSCVALSGREIAYDFCGIKSGQGPGGRLFAVAADQEKVTELARTCNRAGLKIGLIEPPLLAYARALHAKKIAAKFECDVLIAILRDSVLTLCAFRKETLDFITTKNITAERAQPAELCHWLGEQINAVIRFYDLEVSDSPNQWEVTVIADGIGLPDDAEESLRAEIKGADLQLRTGQDAHRDTLVAESSGPEEPSVVAVGLAMGLLNRNGSSLRVNLLPPESAEVKALKKHALITANIAAVLAFLMILAAGALGLMTNKVNENITRIKQTRLSQDAHTLFGEEELIDAQIKQLSELPKRLERILSSRRDIDWAALLNDIRTRTPKTVRITDLLSKGEPKMYLQGLALSYEAIRLFVDMLNKSGHIESASLIKTEKDDENERSIRYEINCSLIAREAK